MQIRINKYLSTCKIGSRRKLEQLLKNKEFRVNGKIAEPGQMIETDTDVITHHGAVLSAQDQFVYIALNKPVGVLSTAKDEHHRTTVLDLITTDERLYPVGRLDKESSGLILLTNNGDLALKLTHPKFHLPKTYDVSTFETVTPEHLKKLADGIRLPQNIKTLPAIATPIGDNSFRIILYQGLKRQIREMCLSIGLNVKTLHRVAIGPIHIGGLKPGKYRYIREAEIKKLLTTQPIPFEKKEKIDPNVY